MRTRLSWLGCVGVLALLFPPDLALGQTATVTLQTGRTVSGEIVRQDDQTVVLRVSGIETPIARDQIQNIETFVSIEDEYRQRRARLADNDLDGRFALADWLYQQQAYRLAQAELDDLAQRYPSETRVLALRNAVEQQLRLLEEQPPAPDADRPEPTPQPTPSPGLDEAAAPNAGAVPEDRAENKLSQEQINAIKVYEVDFTSRPVVVVPRPVLEEVIEKYQNDPKMPRGRNELAALRRASGAEQLQLLFDLRAREFYPQVQIRGDPPALQDFRTRIHQQYVLSYCAANECHGGERAGDLFLFRASPNSDPTVYTNFYILNRYRTAQADMLDRDQPAESLLLQYGMAHDLARFKHPDVPGWHPQIRTAQDPRIGMITSFIDKLYKPAPDYGINYAPPAPGTSTAESVLDGAAKGGAAPPAESAANP